MLRLRIAPMLALMLLLCFFVQSVHAQAFPGPPFLTPDDPTPSSVIAVNIIGDGCEFLDGGNFPYPITQDGNSLRVVFTGGYTTDPLDCIFGTGVQTYSLGSYPPGSYTLDIVWRYPDGLSGSIVEQDLGTLPFTVVAVPAPVSAPALGIPGLSILVLLLAASVGVVLRSRSSVLLLATLAFAPLAGRAQDLSPEQSISILVTMAPGAPTADDLVRYYSQPVEIRSGQPPLQGLAIGSPQIVTYFLPMRATGDFLARLQANPNSTRAQLERYVVATYPQGTDLGQPLAALQADPYVAAAYQMPPTSYSSVELSNFSVGDDEVAGGGGQYGRDDLNIEAAWRYAGGSALIADIDTGLYSAHPALQQFGSTGSYLGGNFIPAVSGDISLTGLVSPPQNCIDTTGACVDERRPMAVTDTTCNPNPNVNIPPATAGHGTHVAGLIVANVAANLGVKGTCKNCGLAMWKTAYVVCNRSTRQALLSSNGVANYSALGLVGDNGTQVVNMSFGNPPSYFDYCQSNPGAPSCLALKHNEYRDVVMVASSGNARTRLDFPASDARVVSAGGIQAGLALWDMSPGSTTNCPGSPFYGTQCGSNYSRTIGSVYPDHQEVMASAQSVLSTTYPGYNWNPILKCGDQFPGPGFGNGIGWCTGTSMSAPQISGVFGLLRSINPLVHGGSDPTTPGTLRNVLATTTPQALAGQGWVPTLGYGIPDAAKAAQKMLGKVAGATVRNRATPLFRLYNAVQHDYADTTSPQKAIGLIISQTATWAQPSTLPAVQNYPSFPYDPADVQSIPIPAPLASVYVLTTEIRPRNEWPALVPLYLLDKPSGSHDDYALATTKADVEYMHAHGYNLRNIQGYIYQPCTPEPGCIPPVAQKFYRACNTTYSDCATFLESEKSTFVAAGYTSTYPPASGTSTLLGYAYPATDTDNDGLPDGFEYVVGTNPNAADSDGDGIPDATEFPMAGIATGDPCMGGPLGARNCGADRIFKNGFDAS